MISVQGLRRRFEVAGVLVVLLSFLALPTPRADGAEREAASPIRVLFLGDDGHHRPAEFARHLIPVFAGRGIQIDYTQRITALSLRTLSKYDCLIVYANIDEISPEQEKALLDYVAEGGGFVPLHCASFCFRNSPKYVELVGAQFKRHGHGVFQADVVNHQHPVTRGFREFETWDETYVHTKHNSDRLVLMERQDEDHREPWTWVRTHGKGRIFYTAYGHDERTWTHPAFHQLVERGIRWVVERPESLQPIGEPKEAFAYAEANVAYYPPERRRRTQGAWNQMQLPLDPAESRKHLQLPPGFDAELFAADPDIFKPVAMAWDARGRLFISETKDYPNNMQPEGQGNDRITICEDTDGDGRADRFKVFADRLSIATSITFAAGGVLVAQAPHMLFLKDTDGDDRADVREVLFTGFSTRDTHAGTSNLRWGFDNWVWGVIGYDGFEGTIGGEKHEFRMGIFRMRADGSDFEFVRSTTNNTWGLGLSEEGFVFASTANGNPSVFMPIANRYYDAVEGLTPDRLATIADDLSFFPVTEKVRQVDWHGVYTAAAGHALYTARSFPPRYWNRTAFVTGPTGHLVGRFALEKRGSEFVARNEGSFLASDDEWSAPIMAEVGPDGALWVIDWYNYIVQHNPTPVGFEEGQGNAYVTDLRDKRHGRIYRVVHEGAKPYEPVDLRHASPGQLVATLSHDNMFWRMHAQRILVERGQQDIVGALLGVVRDPSMDSVGQNPGVVHALWTLHGIGALDGSDPDAGAAALEALSHVSAGVRRAAVQVLPRVEWASAALMVSGALDDSDAHVRLEALLALSEMPLAISTGPAVFAVLAERRNFEDRWIPHAVAAAALHRPRSFLEAAVRAEEKASDSPRVGAIVEVVARNYARDAEAADVLALLAKGSEEGGALSGRMLIGFASGWPDDRQVVLQPSQQQTFKQLAQGAPVEKKDGLVALARRWGQAELFAGDIAEVRSYLLSLVANSRLTDEERYAAVDRAFAIDDSPETCREVLGQISPLVPSDLVGGFIEVIGDRSRNDGTGAVLVEHWDRMTARSRRVAVAVLMRRPAWTATLLDAVEGGAVDNGDLTEEAWHQARTHPEKSIRAKAEALAERGGVPDPDRQKVLAELLPLAEKKGDAAMGHEVFRQKCAQCHRINEEGGRVGPELTGINHRSRRDVLAELIDPNRSVEGNYRQWTVITKGGEVLTGLLTSETRTSLQLLDATAKQHQLERRDVVEVRPSELSLMPVGLEKDLSAEQLTSLLEYLASDTVERKE